MAASLPVRYEGDLLYQIQLETEFTKLPEALKGLGYDHTVKICVVSDSNVFPLYYEKIAEALKPDYPNLFSFVFTAGEQQKNLDTVQSLYESLIGHRFERRDLLIALGGGVVGDLTGFAAATFVRGIDFIQVPTTLLAQVDSSIGGKTGVDFLKYKNYVGAFYQPKLVYMNLSTLHTLPEREFFAGMAEIIKHGLIKNKEYFFWLLEHQEGIVARKLDILEKMVYESCLVKRAVVEADPKEKGERALLNFGHTIGHAVEKKMDFSLLHGECVALGIVAASYLSWRRNGLTQEEYEDIVSVLKAFHLPVKLRGASCGPEDILLTSKSDKKMEGGKIKFVLLKSIGEAYITRDIEDGLLLDAVKAII